MTCCLVTRSEKGALARVSPRDVSIFSLRAFSMLFMLLIAMVAKADSINSVNGPSVVQPGVYSVVTVAINYTASTASTVNINFQNPTNWNWYGSGAVNVNAGTSSVNVPVNIYSPPAANNAYQYSVSIVSNGNTTAYKPQTGVSAALLPTSDSISSVSGPATVTANINSTVTVAVNYATIAASTVNINFQNPTNWNWYGSGAVNVAAGSGTVNVPVTIYAPQAANNAYQYSVSIVNNGNTTAYKPQAGVSAVTSGGTGGSGGGVAGLGASSVYNRVRKLGMNMQFIYPTNDAWTGGQIFRATNQNFASVLQNKGNPWSDAFLSDMKPFQILRFMQWTGGNGDTTVQWSDRTLPGDPNQVGGVMGTLDTDHYHYTDIAKQSQGNGRATTGVAYEWCVDLANRNQSDMWIDVPYRAINTADFPNGNDFNNEYTHKMAILLKTGIDMNSVNLHQLTGNNLSKLATYTPAQLIAAGGRDTGYALNTNLKIYLEYSNEVYTPVFPQNKYCAAQSVILGYNDQYTNERNFAAFAEIRVWKAFQDVFGSEMGNRIVKIAGSMSNGGDNTYTFQDVFSRFYNNTGAKANPWSIKPDAWKWASYIAGTASQWNASVDAAATSHVNLKATMANSFGINNLIGYEGGQSLDSGGGTFSSTQAGYDGYKYWLNKVIGADRFSTMVVYNTYSPWNNNSSSDNWGAKNTVGQDINAAPKYRALKEYIDGN